MTRRENYSSEDEIIPLASSSSSSEDDEDEKSITGSENENSDELYPDASDSDSAPETLTFSSAQEKSRLGKKRAIEVIKTQKEERRQKRKEIHLQNLMLKESKKKKIGDKRLPDDLLAILDKEPASSPVRDEELSEPDAEEEHNIKDTEENEIIYVHGPTMFKCRVNTVESRKPKFISQRAANFKERHLFGKRIRREKSTRQAILKSEKRLAAGHIKAVYI